MNSPTAFKEGEMVRIKAGAFAGFTGKIEEVDDTKFLLKVKVIMFRRIETIQLKCSDVEKIGFTKE